MNVDNNPHGSNDHDERKPLIPIDIDRQARCWSLDATTLRIFKQISTQSLFMAFSFDFGFAVAVVGKFIELYNNDENHTAAIPLVSTLMNTVSLLTISPLFALAVVGSNWLGDLREYQQRLGAQQDVIELNKKKIRIAALNRSGLIIASGVAVPGFLCLFFSKNIAVLVFRQNEAVADIAVEYLQAYAFALPAHLVRTSFEQMMFPLGKAKDMMLMVIPNFVLGSTLAYWLQGGGLGMPSFGVRGIGIAYAINAWLTAILFGLYLRFNRDCSEFNFFNLFRAPQNIMSDVTAQVLKLSAPMCFTIASELLLTFLTGILAGMIGPTAQASLSFVMQFIFLLLNFSIAFGNTCQQALGKEIGAEHYSEARKVARYGVLTTLIWIVPPCLLFACYPRLLPTLLGNQDENIININNRLAPIMVIGFVFEAARFNLLQQLRSLADTWGATIVSFLALAFGLGISGTVGLLSNLDVYGVGMGYTLGLTMATIGLLKRWFPKTTEHYIETVNDRIAKPMTFCETLKSWCPSFLRISSSVTELASASSNSAKQLQLN